jgi:ABC-type dipeptide/oligopeptide/nickel transport system permease subunit
MKHRKEIRFGIDFTVFVFGVTIGNNLSSWDTIHKQFNWLILFTAACIVLIILDIIFLANAKVQRNDPDKKEGKGESD